MNIWRLIAHHEEPDQAIAFMKRRNRIAIGWSAIGDLRAASPSGPEIIGGLIRQAYPGLDNAHLGGPSLWNLYKNMAEGDLVILNAGGRRVCVFEVVGGYCFESEGAEILGYSHQRAACLTGLEPEAIWGQSGSAVASGQNIRWTLAGCGASPDALDAIYREGKRFSVTSTAIERNPEARNACIRHFGCSCQVCGFNFYEKYGELGRDYIHVHHLNELANSNGEYELDPTTDLVPLCPNCHAMVHKKKPAISVEELRKMYGAADA